MSGEFHNAVEDVVLPAGLDESDFKNSLECELCNVKVSSTKILQRHLDGRKHKMRADRKGKTFVCETCEVIANSEIQLSVHLASSKHRNKLLKKDQGCFMLSPNNKVALCVFLFVAFFFFNTFLVVRVMCQ